MRTKLHRNCGVGSRCLQLGMIYYDEQAGRHGGGTSPLITLLKSTLSPAAMARQVHLEIKSA